MELSAFINNLVETFQSLGFHHDLHSTVYVQFVLNKLQHKEKLQWSQYVIQNHITRPYLIIFNTPYARRHSNKQSNTTATSTTAKRNQESSKHVHIQSKSTTTDLSFRQAITPPISLQYFHRVHPASKRKLVQERNLCLNCLESHFVKDCPSRITCKKCQRKHHTALHGDNVQARQRSSQSISQTQFSPQEQPNQTSL